MTNDNPLHNQAATTSPVAAQTYENNPFFVATNGLELLFKKAQSVGIAFAILAGLSFVAGLPRYFIDTNDARFNDASSSAVTGASAPSPTAVPVEFWIILGVIILVAVIIAFFIGIVIRGTADYTAAQLARNKTVTLGEALRGVFANFWGYTWVIIVMQAKLFLWFLLLIVPGFIMSIRYSFTGITYFDKQLKGGSASTQSAALTKGAWLTTFASHTLLNMLTLGAIQNLLVPGTNAVLYQQLLAVGNEKPKAHVLSWVTLCISLFVLVGLLALFILILPFLVIAYASSNQ